MALRNIRRFPMTAVPRFGSGVLASAACALALLAGCAGGQMATEPQDPPTPANEELRPDRPDYPVQFVSASWLAENLGRDDLAVVDCQANVYDYFAAHLPGAVHVFQDAFRASDRGMPAGFVPPAAAEAVVAALGLRADRPVVVSSGGGPKPEAGDGLEQAMTAYALARFGLRRVYVLDGGLPAWRASGGRTRKAFPSVEPSAFRAAVRDDFAADADDVRAAMNDPDTVLIDARPPSVYSGRHGPWARNGHIPDARNVHWRTLMAEDNPRKLRPPEEIARRFAAAGAGPDKRVIVYCGTGREATVEFLILRFLLGRREVRLYEGAYTEWQADPANPVARGSAP